jgi:hypothetical protein
MVIQYYHIDIKIPQKVIDLFIDYENILFMLLLDYTWPCNITVGQVALAGSSSTRVLLEELKKGSCRLKRL